MYDLEEILKKSIAEHASDIHFTVGRPPCYRVDGVLSPVVGERLTPETLNELLDPVLDTRHNEELQKNGQTDFAYAIPGVGRFRVNVFLQRGTYASVMRCLPFEIPLPETLGIPKEVIEITRHKRGLVLVTGPTGSGKSTTLASLLHVINQNYPYHIITLEDPIEYVYTPKKAIINQREVGVDVEDYEHGLYASLREDPDVILIGEMRTPETIETALVAAETGHLVFSTIHTNSAVDSIDRIVGVFPENKQPQIRLQLSMTLKAVLAQQLVPRATGRGRAAACELMMITPPVRNLIRDGRTPQMQSYLMSGGKDGSVTMDRFLAELAGKGVIMPETAMEAADDPEEMRKNFMFR